MKYRKKPVVIDAVQVTAADFNGKDWDGSPFSEYTMWLDQATEDGTLTLARDTNTDYAQFDIHTMEGVMRATAGDYIIRGVQGELYPCKPDIFEATYERVADDLDQETLLDLVAFKKPEEARTDLIHHLKSLGYNQISIRLDQEFEPERTRFNIKADDENLSFQVSAKDIRDQQKI